MVIHITAHKYILILRKIVCSDYFFPVCICVLFYATLMKPQTRTIVISNIDSEKFQELYSEHGELLSCPCSTITTTYKNFVSHTVQFHPVYSSFFHH